MEAPLAPEQQYWVIEPLVDAGLGLEEIRGLVFDLSFSAIVTEGRGTADCLQSLVSDRPAEVQAAWRRVIGRMMAIAAPTDDDPEGRPG
ncbi:hypothetical protein [Modestobacter sp. URMC 112]